MKVSELLSREKAWCVGNLAMHHEPAVGRMPCYPGGEGDATEWCLTGAIVESLGIKWRTRYRSSKYRDIEDRCLAWLNANFPIPRSCRCLPSVLLIKGKWRWTDLQDWNDCGIEYSDVMRLVKAMDL